MILIVGLGNPGRKYINSRHNLGFMVVRELAKELGVKFRYSIRAKTDVAKKKYNDRDVLLALPQTFMNNSGRAVQKLVKQKRISSRDLLVVSDDLDLDFSRMRIRAKGSDAGHRGIKSISEALNTKDFARIRIGISRPESNTDPSDYVLDKFNEEENKELSGIITRSVQACLCWMEEGIDVAMSKFN